MNKLKVYPLYQANKGCDYHRVLLPFLYSAPWCDQAPYMEIETNAEWDQSRKFDEAFAASEIVVLNRNFPTGSQVFEQIRKRHSFKTVVDLDDWVELPKHNPFYLAYKNYFAKEILKQIENADLVTVTTKRLKERLSSYHNNIEVIPNALPYGYGQFTRTQEKKINERFTFVYAGQVSHLFDVQLMQAGLRGVRDDNNIAVSMAGWVNPPKGLKNHPVLSAMENIFKCGPHYRRIHNIPLGEYMNLYDSADGVLVPLQDNDFNAHKSNLKLLEAGCKALPVICSPVAPYIDNDTDGTLPPVFWAKNGKEWAEGMRALANGRDFAAQAGESLHRWAKNYYNLVDWNAVRFEKYANLVGRSFKNDTVSN